MLFDWSTGVSGLGRPGTDEHRGMIKRVRFSYNANKRSMREGDGPFTLDLDVAEEYAIIFFESNLATSKRYTGMPRLSLRPVHWGYCINQPFVQK